MRETRDRITALVELGRAISEAGYHFVTVSPETHRRVDARAAAAGALEARSLRDVFGWSRPFRPDSVPAKILALARAAEAVVADRERAGCLRANVRFSSLRGRLFVHSAYPTRDANAVFFGPDTYRYCDLVEETLRGGPGASRAVDIGCGSGAGGIVAAEHADSVVLSDVVEGALTFAAVNARLAGIDDRVEMVSSDVLGGVSGPVDLVLANPPYMVDPGRRAYRDGGGDYGEGLAVRIVREAVSRLAQGGRLVLYTGAAIVDGVDTFLRAVRPACEGRLRWSYREIDPDVFGEEIEQNDAYARVERIAAVALVGERC